MDDTLSQNETSKTCPQCCCTTSLFFNSPNSQNTKKSSKHYRNSSSECRHTFASSTTSLIFPNTYFTNHESLPSLQESFIEFNKVYPQYSETEHVDHVRANEYSHLSFSNHTCLDYIGIGLFSYSQMQKHVHVHDDDDDDDVTSKTKHSLPQFTDIPFFSISCKTGNLKTLLLHGGQDSEFESAMRKRIMNYLNISENDYFMVFTANRTSAFKLVADCYQFQKSKKLLTVYDHESEAVEAMISSSEKRGAKVMSAEFSWPRLRIQSTKLRKMIVSKRKKKKEGLFVLPLHSRVTGARYPYIWISIAQENGWNVLVDACALGPKDMDCFGLSLFQPEFLICSCYKVFGENPSGFGCLFIKKSVISTLETNSSAGIVNLVQEKTRHVEDSFGIKQKSILTLHLHEEEPFYMTSFSDEFEKGEPSEIKIVSAHEELKPSQRFEIEELENQVEIHEKGVQESDKNEIFNIECRCLDQVDSLGIILINDRARYLINWLVNSMLKLKHPNTEGVPLVKIYGPKVKFDRGPAMAFNIFDWKGEKVEPVLVQKLADRSNISISYGLLHHIWFADKYGDEKGRILKDKKKKDREKVGITVVTIALGFLANFEDIYKLWCFVARFLDADFVEKERWRYIALNQKTLEV
jgi:selenocysteine lyase/cysteine desulfurase